MGRIASRRTIWFPKESLEVTGKLWGSVMKEVVGGVEGKVDPDISRLSLMFYRVFRVFVNANHRETRHLTAVGGVPLKEEEEQEVWLLVSQKRRYQLFQ